MTGRRRPARPSRSGRRVGDSGTREAILEAARARFGGHGYQGATIRAIAADAGVDPALVHHFFGTKEALFAAAMRLPVVPSEVLYATLVPAMASWAAKSGSGPGSGSGGGPAGEPAVTEAEGGQGIAEGAGLGEHLVRTVLTLWDSPEISDTFTGLLRSAVTSESAAIMLREFLAESILATVSKVTGLPERWGEQEADFRVGLMATQMLGLAITRLVFRLPNVVGASVDELAVAIGPTLDRYLSGEVRRVDEG